MRGSVTPQTRGKILVFFVVAGLFVGSIPATTYQSRANVGSNAVQQGVEVEPVITEDTTFTGEIPPYNASKNDFLLRIEEGERVKLTVTNENSTYPLLVEVSSNVGYANPIVRSGDSLELTYPGDRVVEPPYEYLVTLGPMEEVGATGPPLDAFESSYSVSVDFSDDASTPSSSSTETARQLPNTLSIRSTGDERVYYNATASGSVAPGSGADLTGAEQPDEVSGATASGSTAQGGVDNFTFSGDLTALNLEGGPAEVSVNGEQIDPANYQETPTPTPTPSPTPTATPTRTPTATLTPTATSTPTATPSPTPTQTVSPTPTPTPTATKTATPTATSITTSAVEPMTSVGQARVTVTNTQTQTVTEGGERRLNGTDVDTDTEISGSGGPGFGVAVAIVALLVTGLFAARRH